MYNDKTKKYDFTFDKNKLLKLYNDWKKSSLKYTKYSFLEDDNLYNKNREILMREYKNFYIYSKKHKKYIV